MSCLPARFGLQDDIRELSPDEVELVQIFVHDSVRWTVVLAACPLLHIHLCFGPAILFPFLVLEKCVPLYLFDGESGLGVGVQHLGYEVENVSRNQDFVRELEFAQIKYEYVLLNLVEGGGREGCDAHKQLIGQNAKGPNVNAVFVRLGLGEYLRGSVLGSPEVALGAALGQAKTELCHLDRPRHAGEQNILRPEVPIDEPSLVQLFEHLYHLDEDLPDEWLGDLLPVPVHEGVEIPALELLHQHVHLVVVEPDKLVRDEAPPGCQLPHDARVEQHERLHKLVNFCDLLRVSFGCPVPEEHLHGAAVGAPAQVLAWHVPAVARVAVLESRLPLHHEARLVFGQMGIGCGLLAGTLSAQVKAIAHIQVRKSNLNQANVMGGGAALIILFDMSNIEQLTKTLMQVVGSLQELLSSRPAGSGTSQLPAQKLKKTPQMTYNEFIDLALANRKPVEISSIKASYRLQEDLLLLSELSKFNQISLKTFQQIAKSKKIHRSTDSLRARYHDFLSKVDEAAIKKIVSWIEKEGVEGFLTFDNDEVKLQLNDPGEARQEKKRQRPSNIEKEGRRQEKSSRKSKVIPNNCKQLSQILRLYSKMVNIPTQTLAQKLGQLSGDLIALDRYIDTKDARMLWTQEEDEVLRKGGPELEILRRYKGDGVEVRRKYLGI